jgi:hypothetical protein
VRGSKEVRSNEVRGRRRGEERGERERICIAPRVWRGVDGVCLTCTKVTALSLFLKHQERDG